MITLTTAISSGELDKLLTKNAGSFSAFGDFCEINKKSYGYRGNKESSRDFYSYVRLKLPKFLCEKKINQKSQKVLVRVNAMHITRMDRQLMEVNVIPLCIYFISLIQKMFTILH